MPLFDTFKSIRTVFGALLRSASTFSRSIFTRPIATTVLGGTKFKIHQTVLIPDTTDKTPGTPLELNKRGLKVACGGGTVIEIRQLQAEGGKRMAAPDYFRGHPIEI